MSSNDSALSPVRAGKGSVQILHLVLVMPEQWPDPTPTTLAALWSASVMMQS